MKFFTFKKQLFLTLLLSSFILADPPSSWDSNGDGEFDNITDYQNSASLTSQITMDGVDIGTPGDMFAAFVDGELRGIAPHYEVTFGPNQGKYFFLILVYSNASSGELVTFKFYDSETNNVYNINQDYSFVSDDTQGNLFTPVGFTTGDVDDSFACDDVDEDGVCDDVDDCVGELDECGVCNGDGIADGACDCDGNVLDCNDICGGSAVEDDCGVCDGGNASQDCAGVCGGDAVIGGCDNACGSTLEFDECGVCGGTGIPQGNCDCNGNVNDCAGVCGGTAVEDNCGTCDSDSSNDCAADCNGDFGGSAVEDDCGVCEGDGSTCGDCDGINGSVVLEDECGVCGGSGIPEGDCDCDGNVVDCAGECGGSAVSDCAGTCNGFAVEDCAGVCNGDSIEDCDGVCGGSAVVDDCGVCDGGEFCSDGYTCNNAGASICTPNEFLFNSSTQQAAYFFNEVTLGGQSIEANDWVGAFNGDVCVGARKWDVSNCGGGVCDVPVLGVDSQLTTGYMTSGQIPTFKIFKASDLSYNDATASSQEEWYAFGTYVIDALSDCLDGYDECDVCGGDGSSCANQTIGGIPDSWDTDEDSLFDNITDYQNSASLTSQITMDGVDIGTPGDMFAAFVDGELRGIAPHYEVTFGPNDGKYFFLILVYSNESSGEIVTFQFYDAETDLVYNVNETYDFISDDTQGNLFGPVGFTTGDVNDSYGTGGDDGTCDDVDEDGVCDDVDDCVGELDECGVCNGGGIADGACDCDGNVEDCAGVCGGSSVNDECGVCGGSGIPDGDCDCNGNVNDCAGVCGGTATEDCAGVCDGDAVVGGCDNTCGSTLEFDECGVCGGDGSSCSDDGGVVDPTDGCELPENTIFLLDSGDVIYNVPTDFAGVQFNIDGATASSASGGEAAAAGWILQAAGSTVLGFSFSNTEVTTDCGLLFTLSLSGEATGLSSIVFTTVASEAIDVTYFEGGGSDGSCDDVDMDGVCDDVDDCVGDLDECGVCNGDGIADGACDCDGNVEDCAGVCGGSAVNDECGVCGGSGIPDGDCDCSGNVEDCAGVCGGTAELDDCDVCNGDGSSCSDDGGQAGIGGLPLEWDTDSDGLFDNITDYQNSGSMTSAVFLDDLNLGSEGDALAAFVDGEQRGFQPNFSVPFGPYTGTEMFPILIYSNVSSGETVTFQFYDVESDLVYDITETVDFVSDMTLGSFVAPEILNRGDVNDSYGTGGDDGTCDDVDEDGVCDDVDDCIGELDECGVCNGDGIADGTCDCDGNVEDCAGVCGGDSVVGGCDNVCGSTLEFDECGVCGGSGIPQGDCDCSGNVNDCASVCGGDAVEDNCGVCDSDTSNDCEADCNGDFDGDAVEDDCGVCEGDGSTCGDCDGINGSIAIEDDCGICDGDGSTCSEVTLSFGALTENTIEVLYASSGEISGFQVDISGFSFTGGSNETDFTINIGEETILGYSLTGATLPEGSGILVVLDYDNLTAESSSLSLGMDGIGNVDGTVNDGNNNPYATINFGDDLYHGPADCAGEFGGDAVEDNCGTCDDDDSNDCIQDCTGEWGGDALVDECGVCDGLGTDDNSCCSDGLGPNGQEPDCAGECGGNSELDECGVCNGDGIAEGTCNCDGLLPDCAGICYGPNSEDECGVCDNDVSNDCLEDCAGVWGGDATYDLCGVCGGDDTTCADCEGTPNGLAYEDQCGICDNDVSNDCLEDCAGVWGGDATYDLCGVCGGDDTTCADCEGTPNGIAYEDQCGTCDTDYSNDCQQDCNGDWGGDATYDLCGVCGGDNSTCLDCAGVPNGGSVEDVCGVCDGPGAIYGCGCTEIPDGECDCLGNVEDECGVCGGSGIPDGYCDCNFNVEDQCGFCGGSGTSCVPFSSDRSITVSEDSPLDFLVSASTAFGELTGVNIELDPVFGTVEWIGGEVVRYTPDADYVGEDSFLFSVNNDQGFTSDWATVYITVENVNDAPEFSSNLNYTMLEGETIDLYLGVFDIDNDDADLTIVPPAEVDVNGTLTPCDSSVRGSVVDCWTYDPTVVYENINSDPGGALDGGPMKFTFEARDPGCELDGTCNTAEVLLTIVGVNDLPSFTQEEFNLFEEITNGDDSVTIDGDVITIDFTDFIYDPDANEEFTLYSIPDTGTSDMSTVLQGSLDWTGSGLIYDYQVPANGFDLLLVKASDGEGTSNTVTFVYFDPGKASDNRGVPIVNDDAATIAEDTTEDIYVDFFATDFPAGFTAEGSADITLTGPNNGNLTFVSKDIIGGYTARWRYSYDPAIDFNGTDTIDYVVTSDTGDDSDSKTYTMTVTPVNDAPVLTGVENITFDEDTSYIATLGWTDVDNSDLSIEMSTGTNILSFKDENTFLFSALNDHWNGSETFTASISDGEQLVSETFTVTINPVNDLPVITMDSYLSFNEDTTGYLSFTTSDVDGDTMTASIVDCTVDPDELSSNVSASIDGNTISFVPVADYNGSGCYTLTVNDGTADSTAPFDITINPINDAPEIVSTPSTSFNASDGYSYIFSYIDPDYSTNAGNSGGTIVLSLTNATSGITLGELGNNVVSWSDIPSDVYAGSFVVSVSDGIVNVSQSVELEVIQFVDCAGVNNGSATEDCAGTCNGTAYNDECGSCVTEADSNCTQDCDGVWGGAATVDDCGVCDGDNSTCSDCNNTPNGTAYTDQCGSCVTETDPNCTQDCQGIWGGGATVDDCGVCDGDNSTCSDCNNTPNGTAYTDQCGSCVTETDPNCTQDCDGVWGGTATVDDCGVCAGNNSTCSDCAGVPNGNTFTDCAGVCGGTSTFDVCGVCDGDGSTCSVLSTPPSWDCNVDGALDNLTDYQFSMSVTSGVYNAGNYDVEAGDMIAAYVGNEQRGVASVLQAPFGDYAGEYLFLMLIYSNQNSGELVTLKYYDASASVVYDLAEGLTFTSDETLGNINSPEIFNVAQVSNNYYFDCDGDCITFDEQGDPTCEEACADDDNDGVCNDVDLCEGYPDDTDSDNDGTPDGCDSCNEIDFNADGVADTTCDNEGNSVCINDADGDTLCDEFEVCDNDPDNDIDGDGICGDVDTCPNDADDDADGDGVCGDVDACPGGDDNLDADGDGVADLCDQCPNDANDDSDGDGSCDSNDACPNDANNDADADGVCGDVDACEGFDDNVDSDSDSLPDGCDACPTDADNDYDDDGQCSDVDEDDDGDGVSDFLDNDSSDNTVCYDIDQDGCDDCSSGIVDSSNDGTDTDSDGLCDIGDSCPLDANNDSDGDGSCDSDDICPDDDDFLDTDADGVVDCLDACPSDANDDSDGDGSCDSDDICPDVDDFLDTDGDSVVDCQDACPLDVNDDTDGDGVCDTDDVCPGEDDALADLDSDGYCSAVDNCPNVSNEDQANYDGDSEGDACDDDDDNDGADDFIDNNSLNEFVCQDTDQDGCDDCAVTGVSGSVDNDGTDTDGDGACDVGDSDDDNDGVEDDSDAFPFDPTETTDTDGDGIGDNTDICINDSENDADGDGVCESDEINGCTDTQACNYDDVATEDDGSCIVPNVDAGECCDGSSLAQLDCSGVCAGSAVLDNCEVCNGDDSSCTVTLSFGTVIGTSMEVLIDTPLDINDFSFSIDNSLVTLDSVFGGLAEDNGYTMSISGQDIQGTGGSLTSGANGVLTNIAYTCEYPDAQDACIQNISVTSSDGSPVITEFSGSCATVGLLGCTDETACNYDPDAATDDGTCTYPDLGYCCDGTQLDDYGVCGGINDGDGTCTAEFSDIHGSTDDYNTWTMLDPTPTDGVQSQNAELLYNTTGTVLGFEITIHWCPENNSNGDNELICPEGSYDPNAGIVSFNEDTSISQWVGDAQDIEVGGVVTQSKILFAYVDNSLTQYPLNPGCGVLGDLAFNGTIHYVEGLFSTSGGTDLGFSYNECTDCVGGLSAEYPSEVSLSQNYPNPFNPTTNIEFMLVNNSYVELVVFDVMGREVKTLISDYMLEGSHLVTWDGKSGNGKKVPSGIYIYQLISNDMIISKRMTLLK